MTSDDGIARFAKLLDYSIPETFRFASNLGITSEQDGTVSLYLGEEFLSLPSAFLGSAQRLSRSLHSSAKVSAATYSDDVLGLALLKIIGSYGLLTPSMEPLEQRTRLISLLFLDSHHSLSSEILETVREITKEAALEAQTVTLLEFGEDNSDLAVVFSHWYDEGFELAAQCVLQSGRRSVLVSVTEDAFRVGPSVMPYLSSCFLCYRLRVIDAINSGRLYEDVARAPVRTRSPELSRVDRYSLCASLAIEVTRSFAGVSRNTLGSVRSENFASGEVHVDPVLVHPECPCTHALQEIHRSDLLNLGGRDI